jgi:hypothetical protein
MLRRTALVGGTVVWMAPAVQTLAAPAFAAGSLAEENPPTTALSEVTLLLLCGSTYYWAKYNPQTGSGTPTECKNGINVAESNTDATCTAAEAAIDAYLAANTGPGSGKTVATSGCLTGTVNATTGQLCIDYDNCTVVAWTIHDGFSGAPNHCAHKVNGVYADNGNAAMISVVDSAGTICFAKTA